MAYLRGERLKRLREARKITQEELGADIGYSNKQISRWEAGASDISTDALVKLSKHFNVTTDYLLGLVDAEGEHLHEVTLSPIEQRLIDAFRSGRLTRILKILGLHFDKPGINRPSGSDSGSNRPKGKRGKNGSFKTG
jgi:transcriptional regulator with XRE-family HTH domain